MPPEIKPKKNETEAKGTFNFSDVIKKFFPNATDLKEGHGLEEQQEAKSQQQLGQS